MLLAVFLLLSCFLPHQAHAQGACGEWTQTVIGSPSSGSTQFDACAPGTITITSAGAGSSSADRQYMVQRELCGDGTIDVKIESISNGGRAGLEIRADNTPGAVKMGLETALSSFVFRIIRSTTSAAQSQQQAPATGHSWLRLVRNGSQISLYRSSTGANWTSAGTQTISLPSCVRIGMYVRSTNASVATGVFSNLRISGVNIPATTFSFAAGSLSADAGEEVQVCVNIANPCACAPASVQVALQGNAAPHLSGFSTQTLQFQSGDTQKCFSLATAAAPGDGSYTLLLQNPTGGNAAAIGAQASVSVAVTGEPVTPTGCPWAGPDREICRGESVVLGCAEEVQPPAGTFYCYKWTPETGLDDPSLPQPTATPQQTTTYTLYVTDNKGNLVATDGVEITVNFPLPISFYPENPAVCVPNVPGIRANTTNLEKAASCSLTTDIMVMGNYASYSWFDGSTSSNIQIVNPGTYAITVTDNNGCSAEAEVEVGYCTSPTLEIQPAVAMLCDEELLLSANQGLTQYLWSDGSTSNTLLVTEPGTYELTVVDAQGCQAIQKKEVTICKPKIDLVIYNGLYDWHTDTQWSGGQMISEEEEETAGAVTVVNRNDTDGDGIDDHIDDQVMATPIGRNEVDLMKLVIKKPVPDKGGEVVLSYTGEIRFWESPLKQVQVTTLVFPTAELEKTLYIEVLQPSQMLRDIEITAFYLNNTDKVKATGVWAEIRRVFHKRGTVDPSTGKVPDGWPDNPVPGPGPNPEKRLLSLDDIILVDVINVDHRSKTDLSRYGFGKHTGSSGNMPLLDNNPNIDNAIGGRIVFEFEVFPKNITSYESQYGNVFLDITRQIKTARFYIPYSTAHGGQIFEETGSETYPWETDPPKDNEHPNDDNINSDEDRYPNNGLIYSFDGPASFAGISEPNNPANPAYRIIRHNFKEFARIYFGNTPLPDFGTEITIGSRISNKYDWHTSRYLKRNSISSMEIDFSNVSYCYPRFTGIGNGNVQINLLTEAISHGYSLVFDAPENKWLLKDYFGTFAESMSVPNGWNIVYSNFMVITITQGSVPFGNGATFEFNVFKTSNPNSKENFIAPGHFQNINGPK